MVHGFGLDDDTALSILLDVWNPRCKPPWEADPLRRKVREAREHGSAPNLLPRPSRQAAAAPGTPPLTVFPEPSAPGQAMFYGLAGDYVRRIESHTEASPVALLVQLLVAVGNCIGRIPCFEVEGHQHFLNLFAVVVGDSSKARKGTAWNHVRRLMERLDPDWERDHVSSGLSSAEGLIHQVRDPVDKRELVKQKGKKPRYETVEYDPGVPDKRLLVKESEFASTLQVMERQGNVLSEVLRRAWDGETLRLLTKNYPEQATHPHISIIGHITAEELRFHLSATEQANGFGNRFLWVWAKRARLLPEGGQFTDDLLTDLYPRFEEALKFGHRTLRIGFDEAGKKLWYDIYPKLSVGHPGLWGGMLARSEAQVRRLACLYAVLDGSEVVTATHLLAALALWEYCEAGVRFLFANRLADPVAQQVLDLLTHSHTHTATKSEVFNLFNRHQTKQRIAQALDFLSEKGLAHMRQQGGNNCRPTTVIVLGPPPAR
jgi:hypothetical protein